MKEQEIRVLMVEPQEHPKEVTLKDDLRALQEAVGGLIDIIGYDDDSCILINDEGKLIGLEGNRRVCGDVIAGTFNRVNLNLCLRCYFCCKRVATGDIIYL